MLGARRLDIFRLISWILEFLHVCYGKGPVSWNEIYACVQNNMARIWPPYFPTSTYKLKVTLYNTLSAPVFALCVLIWERMWNLPLVTWCWHPKYHLWVLLGVQIMNVKPMLSCWELTFIMWILERHTSSNHSSNWVNIIYIVVLNTNIGQDSDLKVSQNIFFSSVLKECGAVKRWYFSV